MIVNEQENLKRVYGDIIRALVNCMFNHFFQIMMTSGINAETDSFDKQTICGKR